jgi:glycerol-3-phosphate cytidylyltransferase
VCASNFSSYGGLMIYCFDIDGTICSTVKNSKYHEAVVFSNMLEKINSLHDEGNMIYVMTARGSVSGKDWTEFTKKQLDDWGFKYHKLITNQKPHAHYFIDDKGHNVKQWSLENTRKIKGVVAGAFDVIHPGYIDMFEEAKKHCNYLTVCLHESVSNKNKLSLVLSVKERRKMLESLSFVDEIIQYRNETELEQILKTENFDVRILGDDYKNKSITGKNLCKKNVFVNRDHGWSTTKFKRKIYESFKETL